MYIFTNYHNELIMYVSIYVLMTAIRKFRKMIVFANTTISQKNQMNSREDVFNDLKGSTLKSTEHLNTRMNLYQRSNAIYSLWNIKFRKDNIMTLEDTANQDLP